MTLTVKDLIYLGSFLTSIISVFFYSKNRLFNIEKDLKSYRQIIFGERGCLNLVDGKTCDSNRDVVFTAIRKSDENAIKTLDKLDSLSNSYAALDKNVAQIAVYIEMIKAGKTDAPAKRKKTKSSDSG